MTEDRKNKITACLVLIFCMLLGSAIAAADARLNVPMPTMGGKQFWSDVFIGNDMRIQKNVFTGHHRLLDADDFRQAWGSYAECKQAFDHVSSNEDNPKHLVILVHGILRSAGSFAAMSERLEAEGYEATAISYASTRLTIEEHGRNLGELLSRLEGVERVSFVSHSMGGLVLRQTLGSNTEDWKSRISVDQVVMIAPPNQGSILADQLQNNFVYKSIYGISGQQLTTNTANQFPNLGENLGIIAGGNGAGFNPMVANDDDSIVSVEETYLAGEDDFLIIDALHATLLGKEETSRAVIQFLSTGEFNNSMTRS